MDIISIKGTEIAAAITNAVLCLVSPWAELKLTQLQDHDYEQKRSTILAGNSLYTVSQNLALGSPNIDPGPMAGPMDKAAPSEGGKLDLMTPRRVTES